MEPDREWVESLRAELPELPGARVRRLEEAVGFDLAEGLVTSGRDRLYERVGGDDRRAVANVLMNQFAASGVDPASANADELAKLIEARDSIPRAAFLEALAASGNGDFRAETYLGEAVIADESELDPVIERILAANEAQVEQYRSGKEGLLGFFVGQVMKETGGKANPKVVNERPREARRVVVDGATTCSLPSKSCLLPATPSSAPSAWPRPARASGGPRRLTAKGLYLPAKGWTDGPERNESLRDDRRAQMKARHRDRLGPRCGEAPVVREGWLDAQHRKLGVSSCP